MFSFLVEITKTGRISEILWSEPETIVSAQHGSIFDMFPEECREAMRQAVKRCAGGEEFVCEQSLRLSLQKSRLTLCLAPEEKRVLVFGVEEMLSKLDARGRDYLSIVRLFMRAFNAHSRSTTPNMQTDMIQTLAKELISRKRQMQETNSKMNLINEDLNNRLVKDALTGLVSRYQYRTEMEYLIGRNPRKLGVFIFIDVDNFKGINDRYGHAVGDAYLVELAGRLKRLDIKDTVRMRISGDEFGLFIYGMDNVDAPMLESFWRTIKDTVLARPIGVKGYSLPIAISAGMSVYGIDTLDIYELIEFADFAMYAVKRRGKNSYGIFNRDEYHREKG